MSAEFFLKRHDTKPAITSILEDSNGDPVDINGAEVTFIMREIRGTGVVVNALADNMQIDGDTIGHVRYEWQPGDTDEAGGYYAEWEVSFADLGIGTFPNSRNSRIAILEDLGDAGS